MMCFGLSVVFGGESSLNDNLIKEFQKNFFYSESINSIHSISVEILFLSKIKFISSKKKVSNLFTIDWP